MILLPINSFQIKNLKGKGRGVFAKKEITYGTIIGDYVGTLVDKKTEDKLEKKYGLYAMSFNDKLSIFPHVSETGAHLFNHSCSPNCDTLNYRGHVLFFTLRKIFPGEELSFSYNLSPLEVGEKEKYACHCGSQFCRGDFRSPNRQIDREIVNLIKQQERKYPGKIKAFNDAIIAPLGDYPKMFISNNPLYDIYGHFQKEPLLLNDKVLPKLLTLRKIIRESGLQILFPKINIQVIGIVNGKILAKNWC